MFGLKTKFQLVGCSNCQNLKKKSGLTLSSRYNHLEEINILGYVQQATGTMQDSGKNIAGFDKMSALKTMEEKLPVLRHGPTVRREGIESVVSKAFEELDAKDISQKFSVGEERLRQGMRKYVAYLNKMGASAGSAASYIASNLNSLLWRYESDSFNRGALGLDLYVEPLFLLDIIYSEKGLESAVNASVERIKNEGMSSRTFKNATYNPGLLGLLTENRRKEFWEAAKERAEGSPGCTFEMVIGSSLAGIKKSAGRSEFRKLADALDSEPLTLPVMNALSIRGNSIERYFPRTSQLLRKIMRDEKPLVTDRIRVAHMLDLTNNTCPDSEINFIASMSNYKNNVRRGDRATPVYLGSEVIGFEKNVINKNYLAVRNVVDSSGRVLQLRGGIYHLIPLKARMVRTEIGKAVIGESYMLVPQRMIYDGKTQTTMQDRHILASLMAEARYVAKKFRPIP